MKKKNHSIEEQIWMNKFYLILMGFSFGKLKMSKLTTDMQRNAVKRYRTVIPYVICERSLMYIIIVGVFLSSNIRL